MKHMNKILLILFLLVPFISKGQNFFWSHRSVIDSIQVDYESTSGYYISASSDNDIVVGYPNNIENDDVLILVIINKESISFTIPSGWTELDKVNNSTMSYGFYWRRADGTEPATQQITMGTSDKGAIIFNYRGMSNSDSPYNVDSNTPIKAIYTGETVTGTPGDLALNFWVINKELTATNNSASGWTEDYNNGSSGTNGFTWVAASYLLDGSSVPVLEYPYLNSFHAQFQFVLPD